jgi:hypothetical protein
MNESIFPGTRDDFAALFPTLGSFPFPDLEDLADALSDWIGTNHPDWPENYEEAIHQAIEAFTPVLGGTLSELLDHLDSYPYFPIMLQLVWAEPEQGGG